MPQEEATIEGEQEEQYSADEFRMRLAEERNRRETGEAGQTSKEQGGRRRGTSRIGMVEGMLMTIVSLIFDTSQALLTMIGIGFLLNPFISFFAWLTFFVWLGAKGMTFGSALKSVKSALQNPALLNIGTLLVGMIPGVNALPERTVGTIAIIVAEYLSATVVPERLLSTNAGIAIAVRNGDMNRLHMREAGKPASAPPVSQKPKVQENKPMGGGISGRPDWMHDKKVDQAMKLRNERAEVAERLGMDKGTAAKHILDLEKKDAERGTRRARI